MNGDGELPAILFSCLVILIGFIILGAILVTKRLASQVREAEAATQYQGKNSNAANAEEATDDGMVYEDLYDVQII